MRLLASICNQRAGPVKHPGAFLIEIDADRHEARPVVMADVRLADCVGVTGLAPFGDDLLVMAQFLNEMPAAVRLDRQYRVRDVWPLALAKDAHSVAVVKGKAYIASTGTDAIVEFDPRCGEKVFWRANELGEDTLHVNSVLWWQGCLYATAFGPKRGATWATALEGYLLNLTAGHVVAEPIAHPHSATVPFLAAADGIYYCESTRQAVCREDGQRLTTGSGFTRGLVVTGTHLYVGVSQHRGAQSDPCNLRVYRRQGGDLGDSQLLAVIGMNAFGQEIYDLLPL